MVQILLIRPGSTDYDEQRRIQGNLKIPLNERGMSEVARAIDEFRERGFAIDTIYAPDYDPALQTAKAIAQSLDVRLRTIDKMENLNQGLWQGMLIEDVRLKQPKVYRQWQEQPEHICPPEGEMLSEAEERVQAAMSRLVRRHKDGMIAVVAPEPLASIIRRFLEGCPLGDLWKAAEHHGKWDLVAPKTEAVAG